MREPLVSTDYPELHHYTDWDGLNGILSTGTLWSTYFKNLNDFTEVEHLRDHITNDLTTMLSEYILKRNKSDGEFKHLVFSKGTVAEVASGHAKITVDTLYGVTFKGIRGPAFAEPFITSFCFHDRDQQYEKRNGLLSQWRGYGKSERYAIVFDTKKLEDLIGKEAGQYKYQPIAIFDVYYSNKLKKQEKWYQLFMNQLTEVSISLLNELEPEMGNLYMEFVTRAGRLKHQGFSEEREVRIFANPYTEEVDKHLRDTAPDLYEPPKERIKPIMTSVDGRRKYIVLFDTLPKSCLPIKRIIVGPHKNKEEHASKVGRLVGKSVRIDISKTPFIG